MSACLHVPSRAPSVSVRPSVRTSDNKIASYIFLGRINRSIDRSVIFLIIWTCTIRDVCSDYNKCSICRGPLVPLNPQVFINPHLFSQKYIADPLWLTGFTYSLEPPDSYRTLVSLSSVRWESGFHHIYRVLNIITVARQSANWWLTGWGSSLVELYTVAPP